MEEYIWHLFCNFRGMKKRGVLLIGGIVLTSMLFSFIKSDNAYTPVSYTHLTLPTILRL